MTSDLAANLLIKPESRVLLLNAPIGYARKLQPLPEGVTVVDRRSETAADVSIVFTRNAIELKRLQSGFAAMEEDAVLWVCYPKGGAKAGTDLDREVLHAALEKDELAEVMLIAFDETWSCMRFQAPEEIGT